MEKIIYLFRHGETDWNRDGRMQGGTDIALNGAGRAQALLLAEFFRLNPVDAFLSSDLVRARETAEIARGQLSVPIHIDPRLRETNLGDVEGMTIGEIEARYGVGYLQKWRALGPEHEHFRFPNGESRAEHLARLVAGLREFLHSKDYRVIGVASHGGAIRRLIHHMRPDLKEPVMIGNCVNYQITYHLQHRHWKVELEPVCKPESRSL